MKDYHSNIANANNGGATATCLGTAIGNDKRQINWMLDINNETALPLKSNTKYKRKYTLNLIHFSESELKIHSQNVLQNQSRTNQGRIEGEREEKESKAKGDREEGGGKEGQREGEKEKRRKWEEGREKEERREREGEEETSTRGDEEKREGKEETWRFEEKGKREEAQDEEVMFNGKKKKKIECSFRFCFFFSWKIKMDSCSAWHILTVQRGCMAI